MPLKNTFTSAFRSAGILVMSLVLASCSTLDLSKKEAIVPSQTQKDRAEKPKTREITIPLEKAKPANSGLPEELTEIQPTLEPRELETKGLRFTMSARGVDIKNVLFALSQEIEQNIIIAPGVNKLASVDLKNVTLEEALESLLPPLGLEYEIDGNFIRVQREKMQTRTFFLNYVISKRKGKSILKSSSGTSGTTSSSGGGSGQSDANTRSTSSVEASEETDIWTEILDGLKNLVTPSASTTGGSEGSSGDSAGSDSSASGGDDSGGLIASLLGGGGGDVSSTVEDSPGSAGESLAPVVQEDKERAFLIVNRQAGMIVVKDFPEVLLQVAAFLEAVEGSIQRQVFIQARIIEVTLNDDYQLGINWGKVSPFTLTHAGGTSLAGTIIKGAADFTYGLAGSDFSLVIDALSKQGQVSVLSSPKIATLNNQRAVIKVGTEDIFFRPEVTAATTTSAATTEYIPQAITIGIVLDVIPQINPNGQIMMSINTSITEKSGERTSPDGINVVPILDVRETNNIVLAQNGQTIIIGGLMKTRKEVNDNSIPFLGALPYIGRLFHWTQETTAKTELVIMLTPEIMVGKTIDNKFLSERDQLRNIGYDVRTNRIVTPSFKR